MNILITGGAGSIGSELARKLLRDGHDIRVMDTNEEGLWSLKAELPAVEVMLGDVQFVEDIRPAADGIESFVHCAAYKHVDLCETTPYAAYRVNDGGTANVVHVAKDRKVVLISTDKAINPSSIMGQTKKLAEERAVMASNASIVRFGNVLGSRGSLVPALIRYRDLGRPMLITGVAMTRFFMCIDEAVELICEALFSDASCVPLPPARLRSAAIGPFVEVCRDLFAPGHALELIGPRPGERTHESMVTREGKTVRSDDERFLMDKATIEKMLIAAFGEPEQPLVARAG